MSVEPVLTPFLDVPVYVPNYANQYSGSVDMVFGTAQFGRQLPRGTALLDTRFLLVRADPPQACTALRNSAAIDEAVSLVQQLRMGQTGGSLQVAVVVQRGGCSFVHKTAIVANYTSALNVVVVNHRAVENKHKIVGMADDGTAAHMGPRLARVAAVLAPVELDQLFAKTSLNGLGMPDGNTAHLSHYLVVQLGRAEVDEKADDVQSLAEHFQREVRRDVDSLAGMLLQMVSAIFMP